MLRFSHTTGRRQARSVSKTDERDAQAIALLVWREETALPRVSAEDETTVLDVLVSQRDAALAEATRLRNQAHQLLLQSDPSYREQVPALTSAVGIAALMRYQPVVPSPLQAARAAAIRMLGERLRLVSAQADTLKEQIEACAQAGFSPLTRLAGVQALSAGMLTACLGPGVRFPTEAALALYAGVAPLEASSAGRVRHRLNRGGNRRLNAVIHRIAVA
jgi:transposase